MGFAVGDRRARRHGRRRDPAARPASASPARRSTAGRSTGARTKRRRRTTTVRRQVGPPRRPQPVALRHRQLRRARVARRPGAVHCASASPTTATSRRETTQRKSYDLLAEGFGPGLQRPAPDRRSTSPAPVTTRSRRCSASATRSPTPTASLRSRRAILNEAGDTAIVTGDPRRRHRRTTDTSKTLNAPAQRRAARRARRHRCRGARHRPDGVLRGRQRAHHASACRCSSARSWACRSSCS